MITPPWGKNAVELLRYPGAAPDWRMEDPGGTHFRPHPRESGCSCGDPCLPCGFRSQSCEGCKSLYSGACFPCCLSSNDGHYYRSIPADLVSPGWCPGREER